MALNIGEAIGPIFGGAMTHYYSFELSCYYMCLINLIYVILFFFYNFSKLNISKLKEIKKDPESDYEYKLIQANRKKSENMEHYALGRYRAFSFANMSSKHTLD